MPSDFRRILAPFDTNQKFSGARPRSFDGEKPGGFPRRKESRPAGPYFTSISQGSPTTRKTIRLIAPKIVPSRQKSFTGRKPLPA